LVALNVPAPFRQKTVFATQSHASFAEKIAEGGGISQGFSSARFGLIVIGAAPAML
jgi:hypothetical protein